MNIFNPLVSGSLSVSGSGRVSGDLTVLGTLFATISGTAQNSVSTSHAAAYTLTSSFNQHTNSFNSFTSSYSTGSFTGSFIGDGADLYNIPASGVTGLNLSQISQGSATASISQADGFIVNTKTTITGSVNITGSISLNGEPIGTGKLDESVFNSYSSSINSFTNSINTTIKNKMNSDGLLSGSEQVTITGTTGFSGFSSSISQSISKSLSDSKDYTDQIIGAIDFATPLLSLEQFSSSIYSYTSSNTTNINAIHTATSSLNTFSSSILSAIEVTGSNLTIKGDLLVKGTTTQIDSTTLNIGDNIIQLNGTATNNAGLVVQDASGASIISGSLLWDTATDYWKAGKLGSEERIILNNEYNTFSTSVDSRASSLENSKNSLNSYTSSNDTRLGIIETTTGSLNSYTSSTNTRLNVIEGTTSSLNTYTSSTNERLNSIETASGSIRTDFNSYTSSNNTKLNLIETSTGSLNSYTSSNNTRLDGIETTTGSLNSYTSSNTTNINAIHTATSSLNSFTNSIDTTIKNKLNNDGVISGSVQVNITQTTGYSTFSGSIATTDATQNDRITALESVTGSYATTGSSNIVGNQTITGSVYITQNLTVLGTSSFLYLTASQLAVSSSTISVNVFEPAERFGGLKVYDSGSESHQATASLLWDSQNNKWVYQNAGAGGYSGGMLISGPRNTGSLGEEVGTIANVVMKGQGGDHITGSNITDDGSNVRVNSNTVVTGSLIVTSTVSGTNITAIETTTASLNSFTSSATSRLTAIETATSSLNTHTSSTNARLGLIETSTGSLNSYTTSNNSRLNTIESTTSSLNSYTSSTNARLSSIETSTGSLNTFTSSTNSKLTSIESTTSSLNSYTSSNTTNINAIHTATSSLNSFSSSANSRLGSIESSTSSLNTFTNSFNSAFSLSGADVTVRGNFTVSGTTTTVNSTTVAIGDNIIQLNGSGATNAGIVVRDATSPTTTSGSLLWDTTSDKWIAGPLGAEDDVVLRTTSQTLTNKTISGASNTLSNIGNSSLTNSSITIAGTSTSLGGSISAATILSSTGVVSGSAQLTSTFVQKAGDSMSGQLVIASTGTAGAATLKVNTSTATSFIHSQENFSANMTAGQTNILVVGQAGSTKNAGYLGYNWSSSASNSNYVSLGHWGADNLLRVYGDGTVYMGTVTTGVWNGSSIGTAYTDAKITSVTGTSNQVNVSASTGAVTFSLPQNIHTAATPTFGGLTINGGATTATFRNTTASSNSNVCMGNDASANGTGIALLGSTFATSGQYRANGGYIYSNLSGGLTLHAEGANSMFLATNGTAAITINSSQVVTFTNTISGSINGNAATASAVAWSNVSSKPAAWLNAANLIEDVAPSATAFPSGFYQDNGGSGNPVGTWFNYINVRHSNTGNGHGYQLGMSYYDSNLWYRSYQGGTSPTFASWRRAKDFTNSTYATTFSNVSSVTVTHNLGSKDVMVMCYDSSDDMFWPSNIRTTDTNTVTITFAANRTGRVVVLR